MHYTDIVTLSTASEDGAAHYSLGVKRLLSLWPVAQDALDAAMALDPGLALARSALARLFEINAKRGESETAIERASKLVYLNGTARKQNHLETLSLGINGRQQMLWLQWSSMEMPGPTMSNLGYSYYRYGGSRSSPRVE